VKILEKFRRNRDLRKLRAEAERTPSPQSLGALAQAYIAAGELDEAERTARQGAARFPASARLTDICRFADRQRSSGRIAALRREMASRPDPAHYKALAEIHLAIGEEDRALSLCEQCFEMFPLFEAAHLIAGEIRLRRFLGSRVALEAEESERHLRRVLKLDPRNTRAATLLGLLFFVVGARESMAEVFRTVLAAVPTAHELEELSQAAQSARLWEKAVEARHEEELEADERNSLAELARLVEVRGQFRNSPHMYPVDPLQSHAAAAANWARLDEQELRQTYRQAASDPGILNLVALSGPGEPVAEAAGDRGMGRDDFASLTAELRRHGEEAARRMDLGSLQWCTVEGPFGGVTICRLRDLCLGMMHKLPLKAERAHRTLEELASRSYVAPAEVGRA
jgi:tetratricopeptide (TPR) repeat protein